MSQPLIKRKLVPRQLSYIPSALLIGKAGAGKTTLVKKLWKISHQTDVEESKVPQEENVYSVVYDGNAFVLIDTLGTDTTKRLNTQADSQEIDTKAKISTIFFVIKYDTRFEKMICHYFELEVSVPNDADKIVVMISHWDQSKSPEEDFKEICDLFGEECPHLMNIIFYSEQYVNAELTKLMYSCISSMHEVELTCHVSKDEIENSRNTSSQHCQKAENEAVNNCLDSICSTTFEADKDKEERRIKKDLKRSFDQCQSDSDSLPMLRQENGTSSEEFNENAPQSISFDSFGNTEYMGKTNEYVARGKPKKMKQESNTLPFWRRWQDYCCIS
jgi:predicted GTPase